MKNSVMRTDSKVLKTVLSQVLTTVIQVILLCISATIISNYDISNTKLFIFWYIIVAISSIISGYIIAGIYKTKGFLWGALAGSISSIVPCILLFLLSKLSVNFSIILLIPAGILCGSIGGIISSNIKR